jgi:hypothetical protein
MPLPPDDALLPESDIRLRLADLALRSGLTEVEVLELVECGALVPDDAAQGERLFGWRSITVARMARRFRDEFELEPHGVAVLLRFADRIRELEQELRELRARLPR